MQQQQQQLEYSAPPPSAVRRSRRRRTRAFLSLVGVLVVTTLLSFARAPEIRLTSTPSHGRGTYLLLQNGVAYLSIYPPGRFAPGWHMNEGRRSAGYSYAVFTTAPERALFRYLRLGVYRRGGSQVIVSFPLVLAALPAALLLRRRGEAGGPAAAGA